MMAFFLFLCLMWFFAIFNNSLHFIVLLVLVEFMVLFSFMFFIMFNFSYLMCIFFLLVGVCMGSYSISLFINLLRHKGYSYLMSFFYF